MERHYPQLSENSTLIFSLLQLTDTGQGRVWLAADMEAVGCQRHSGGQGAGPKAHGAAWHPGQDPAQVQGDDEFGASAAGGTEPD